MGTLKRVLAGDDTSWGAAIGALLLLSVGLGFFLLGTADLFAAVAGPKTFGCAEFLADPTQARWVTLTGCRLELPGAAQRHFKGWLSTKPDGGSSPGRSLELFIPLGVLGTAPTGSAAVLVATADPALLSLVDQLARLPDEAALDAFVDAHAAEFEASLAPKELTGYIEPVTSVASRTARSVLENPASVVLQQGRQPAGGKSLCSVLLGFALAVWALLPVMRRWQLIRETEPFEAPAPPKNGET